MGKSLATVIRLQRWQVDAERRNVNDADAVVRGIEDALNALAERCEEEKRYAHDAVESGSFAFGPFLQYAAAQRAELDDRHRKALAHLGAARQRLAEAYREQRKFELAEAEERRRLAEARAKKEQETLDEIALTQHVGRLGANRSCKIGS